MCWEVDEAELAVLNALQNVVDVKEDVSKALGCPSDLCADGNHRFIVEMKWGWCLESESDGVGNRDDPVVSFADSHACEGLSSSRRVGDDLELAALGVEHAGVLSECGCDTIMALAVGMGVVQVVGKEGEWEGGEYAI